MNEYLFDFSGHSLIQLALIHEHIFPLAEIIVVDAHEDNYHEQQQRRRGLEPLGLR